MKKGATIKKISKRKKQNGNGATHLHKTIIVATEKTNDIKIICFATQIFIFIQFYLRVSEKCYVIFLSFTTRE